MTKNVSFIAQFTLHIFLGEGEIGGHYETKIRPFSVYGS
jgi:hypothetical protein